MLIKRPVKKTRVGEDCKEGNRQEQELGNVQPRVFATTNNHTTEFIPLVLQLLVLSLSQTSRIM